MSPKSEWILQRQVVKFVLWIDLNDVAIQFYGDYQESSKKVIQ